VRLRSANEPVSIADEVDDAIVEPIVLVANIIAAPPFVPAWIASFS
jgi:hypothetical protein